MTTIRDIDQSALQQYNLFPGRRLGWSLKEFCLRWKMAGNELTHASNMEARDCPHVAYTCRLVARMLFEDAEDIRRYHASRSGDGEQSEVES